MSMRIGGLASGMDIDSIVEKLMVAERTPLDKLEQKKQTYEWQRDAYRDVNTKLKTFDTYIADNLILKSLNEKSATVSNTNYLTATATSSASGTLSVEGISQIASASRAVGSQINAIGSTLLKDLGISESSIELKAIQSNGTLADEATKIEFDPNTTTVDQLISKINASSAGVSTIFENGRLSITAKNTGDVKDGAEIVVTAGNAVFGKLGLSETTDLANTGKNAVFQVNGIATERSSNIFTISGYTITLKDTFNQAATVAEKYNAAYTEWVNASDQGKLDELSAAATAANDALVDPENQYKTSYDNLFSNAVLDETNQETYNTINNKNLFISLSSEDFLDIKSLNFTGSTEEEYKQFISENAPENLKGKLSDLTISQFQALQSLDDVNFGKLKNAAELEAYNSLGTSFLSGLGSDEITKLSNMSTLTESEYNATIDTLKNSATEWEKALGEKLSKLSSGQKETLRNLSDVQLENFTSLADLQVVYEEKFAEKNAADAAYTAAIDRKDAAEATLKTAYSEYKAVNPDDPKLQGVTETNLTTYPASFDVSGSSTTPVTLTSTTNIDDMVTKIKDFVNTYNGLILDLNNLTKESKYRDFPPLTAAQKKEMEEKEIEMWEEKAKSGLLRGDSIIQNGLSSMRNLIYQSNPGLSNSKYNTLFSIGITTSKNYNEGGTLEINETKLRAVLEEDPDAVTALFRNAAGKEKDEIIVNNETKVVDTRGYLQKLRDAMDDIKINIENRAGRSTMTETQFTLGKYLRDVNNRIETWEDKLISIEDRYWKQFSAMEAAISKANSQFALFAQQ